MRVLTILICSAMLLLHSGELPVTLQEIRSKIISPSSTVSSAIDTQSLNGEFWKDQALKDIIPYWTRNEMDHKHGAFITNLDRKWQPLGSSEKYPIGYSSASIF
ncbi:MAG: hypothetical protein V1799_20985 [bacterium]